MELLQLESKPVNWKKERVEYWRTKYAEVNGRQPKEGWAMMMGMMVRIWEASGFVDETTGAIEFDIPPMEDWITETDWYFRDKWAAEKCGFSFSYFLKRYGQWEKKTVVETPVAQFDTCKYCGQRMERRKISGHYYQCSKNPNLKH